MPSQPVNLPLIVGAVLSAIASLLHVAIIAGGPSWYRFFGAGEHMARMAEAGRWLPGMVTAGIAAVLGLWAAYALAGAGVVPPLPLLKPALAAITAIYLLRGIAPLPVLLFTRQPATPFLVWSSLICAGYGLVHLIGLVQVWDRI